MKRRDDAYDLRKIFEEIELDLVRNMRKTLAFHEKEEEKHGFKWEQWQRTKLRNIQQYRKENKQIIGDRSKEIEKLVTESIQDNYQEGQNIFIRVINKIKGFFSRRFVLKAPVDISGHDKDYRPAEKDFFHMNDRKIKALQEAVNNDLQKANAAALRKMDDVYRKTIYRAEMHMAAGAKTLRQAIDMATREFLQQGLRCIEYSDGKRINIASYAEMALRTASHRATLMGEGKKRAEWGIYTVVVSAHANTCKLCEPWQGKILIDDVFSDLSADKAKQLSKETGYNLLSYAMKKGLLHPNCRHAISTYFPGITKLPEVPDGEKAIKRYDAEQTQRYLERQIKKWKMIAEGSQDPDNVAAANREVKRYQGEIREHLKEHDYLRRDYAREKNIKA